MSSMLAPDITNWCGQCDKHLKQSELAPHTSHSPLRRVGLGGNGLFWWVYGDVGLRKTRFAVTLPPPIRFIDTDLGTRSIENEVLQLGERIHLTHHDPENSNTHEELVAAVGNFNPAKFESLVIDSADGLERAAMVRTLQLASHETMEMWDWNPSGERFGKVIRQLKWYAEGYGIQVLVISNEDIDKEYLKGAFIKQGNSLVQQEPIGIKGLPSLAGKWAKKSSRLPDIILHARWVSSRPALVANRENIPNAGGAVWEVKDRTGRLEKLPPCSWEGSQYGNGICPPDFPILWKAIKGDK